MGVFFARYNGGISLIWWILSYKKNKPQRNESIFHDINILCGTYFDLVNWEATNKMIYSLTHLYRLWVDKHVPIFIGVNYTIFKCMEVPDPGCPCLRGQGIRDTE